MKDYGEGCDYYMERWKGEMVIWWNKAVRRPTVLYRRLHSADQKDQPDTKHTPNRLHSVSSRPVGVPAKARSGLVG